MKKVLLLFYSAWTAAFTDRSLAPFGVCHFIRTLKGTLTILIQVAGADIEFLLVVVLVLTSSKKPSMLLRDYTSMLMHSK